VSDALTDGRRFRILCIVDDYTRECLCLIADTSLSGLRVARELDLLMLQRGRPHTVVSDNGTELTSMAILRWSQDRRIEWHYTAPGLSVISCVAGDCTLRRHGADEALAKDDSELRLGHGPLTWRHFPLFLRPV